MKEIMDLLGNLEEDEGFWGEDEVKEHPPLWSRQALRIQDADGHEYEPGSESKSESEAVSTSVLEEAPRSGICYPRSAMEPGNVDVDSSNIDGYSTCEEEDEEDVGFTDPTLMELRKASLDKLALAWLDICFRYGKTSADLPPDDVVDLATGRIIVDNGFLRSRPSMAFGSLTRPGP
ncbi:MAG: hypothetical protein J3Q66DRAFT_434987 [Benniella sp.]|nr:MAG: hypothetical protein J3Q66DRAFT_434987 [Benniella sp.]